jgi:polysaccharide export outer membrane protein
MSYKKLQYIREGASTDYKTERKSKTIKPFDELYIKVLSTDEKTAAIFTVESRSLTTDLHLVSYTVDEKGEIYFPFVGSIYVKDLTLEEASEKIQSALSQYLLNTAIRVRFINNSVTVLGEVVKGGDFTFSTDKLSIFQAIGLAGGITAYGNREKVTVIRMIDNKTTFNEVNLAAKNIVESKFYYIEPNDVVIVTPVKAVTRTFQNYTYATVLASISSLMAVLLFIKTY